MVNTLDDVLRAVASPDLYRNNAFRLAGLSVDAPPADVRRRATEIRGIQTLGGTPPSWGPLPVHPAVDAQLLVSAVARLREPVGRLVDAFFWFWPENSDAGLPALAAGDVERAEAIWDAAGTVVARHNLAVLNHALALDDEHAGRPPPRSGAPMRWRLSYQHWLAVWRSDAFWDVFAARVAAVGHPGLGPATASTFRAHLPVILASISADVALRCRERGLADEAVLVHWRLANYQGFPADTRAEAARAATDSIVARIRARIDDAAAAVSQRPGQVWGIAHRLHDQTGPLLHTLALSGAADTDGVHDAVARQVLRCAVAYHARTADDEATLRLLALARHTARGDAVVARIRENADVIDQRIAARKAAARAPHILEFYTPSPPMRLSRQVEDFARRVQRGELTEEEKRPPRTIEEIMADNRAAREREERERKERLEEERAQRELMRRETAQRIRDWERQNGNDGPDAGQALGDAHPIRRFFRRLRRRGDGSRR